MIFPALALARAGAVVFVPGRAGFFMPVYGSFETVREVSRSGRGAVYTARRVGTSDERFAVKIFELPAYLAEEGEVERESAFFLHAAEVQKAVGSSGSAWAPVHESGALEGGAWYATDLFDRSIERLLLNRPDLEPADLLRVVDSVLSGLYELRDAAGRAHGNLKNSNVLLSGKGDLSSARVVLCDPWATERLRGGEAREDLRGLGDLVHWMVLHRGVRRPTGWPVQASAEWKRLGRVGDGWLALTNKLLDPTDEKLVLEDVPSLVPGGKVRPGSSTTMLPTPVSRAGRDSRADHKSHPPKSEPPKSQPPKSEPAKPEPPKSEPPKPEAPKPEPVRVEMPRPEAALPVVTPAVVPPAAKPPSRPAEPVAPAAVDADVTQDVPSDLPSHGSGAGSRPGIGSGVGAGSREAGPVSGGVSGGVSAGVGAGSGAGAPVLTSRAPSMASVGRVSTASLADAPKSFEELEAESRRRQAEPKKTSNAKWIGIGVGAVALVAVAAVVISNMGGGEKDTPKDNKNGVGPVVINDPPKDNTPTVDPPKVDPPKNGGQGTPEVTDAQKQAEEARKAEQARKIKEAADKASADKAAADKAAKDEADRKAKEAADKTAADKAASDKAAKDEADRKAKEVADKAAADKATADKAAADKAVSDKAAKDEADRIARETADKAARDKASADKAAADKATAEKAAADKATADKAAKDEADRKSRETADKAAADKAAADKAAADKAAADSAKVRLNLLVQTLRDELAKAGDDASATAAVAKFKAAAGALGAEVAPLVAPMIAGLDAAAKTPEAPAGPMLDFAKVGPMSVGGGWSLDAAHPAAGDLSNVTYKSPSGQSVQFIRLGSGGAYLSATEVTVGVFNDAAQRDAELLNLLFSLNTGKAGNKGPSVWERNTNKDGIVPSRPGGWDTSGWLFDVPSLVSAKFKPYPDELLGSVGTPSALHPMQQVSSTVASRAAGKIGCRLPTAEEWKAAAEMSSSADARTPNRRDATWDAYKVYLDGQFKNLPGGPPMDAPWPDKGSFDPKKTNTGPKAVAAVAGNDQVLWFREVGVPDGRFHDLIGNAAEWVAPVAPASGPTPNDVARAQVIGASAISSDQLAPEIAQDPANRTRAAFSDVGFRLAFDAVGGAAPVAEPLIARLKKAANAIVLAK